MSSSHQLNAARLGDQHALAELFTEIRPSLYRFIYRMLAQPDDAEDLLQEVWLRGQAGISAFRGEETSLKSWWFTIASNLCLNHLGKRKRWRIDAQLIGEQELDSEPETLEQLAASMNDPSFRYETAEHISFCLSCVGRSLEPSLQAAIFLREIFDFSNQEAAHILGLSEPVFRHKLAAARAHMTNAYDGLCQLINKTGRCYQCVTLREFAPEDRRAEGIVRINPAPASPGNALADALLDARFDVAKWANLEEGGASSLHEFFFRSIAKREESRANTGS